MAHKNEYTPILNAVEQVIENGFEGLESAVTILLNEALESSLLRLVSAVLMEISEEWESSGKIYIRQESDQIPN